MIKKILLEELKKLYPINKKNKLGKIKYIKAGLRRNGNHKKSI